VLARDLAVPYPTVSSNTPAIEAARAMASENKPGLIVCHDDGRPYTVLPGSQVLRFLVPPYVQDDPVLARVLDDAASEELCRRLSDHSVRELLPRREDQHDLPVVDPGATALEVAAVMARLRSPLVAVVDGGRVLGAITVARLLDHLLQSPSSAP
jgi:CBS domain-containing protein